MKFNFRYFSFQNSILRAPLSSLSSTSSPATETSLTHSVGAIAKPTKYHYYPHNQHMYLLPECAVQQVGSASFRTFRSQCLRSEVLKAKKEPVVSVSWMAVFHATSVDRIKFFCADEEIRTVWPIVEKWEAKNFFLIFSGWFLARIHELWLIWL